MLKNWKLLLIVFPVLLLSCTPQKRLNKLIKKYPELISIDTVSITDTFLVDKVVIDTFINYKYLIENDTIIVQKEKLRLQYVRIRDTIRVKAECLPDTIIKKIKIPVKNIHIIKELERDKKIRIVLLTICIIFGLLTVLREFKK